MATRRKPKPLAPEGTPGEKNPLEGEARERCNQLLGLLHEFTPEEALRIKRHLELVIPIRLSVKSEERRWKYRCNQCQGICLEFKGEQFIYFQKDGENMAVSDRPPLEVPLEELPWVPVKKGQRTGRGMVQDLRCPYCGMRVSLRPDRSLLSSLIVETRGEMPDVRPKDKPGRVSLKDRSALAARKEED